MEGLTEKHQIITLHKKNTSLSRSIKPQTTGFLWLRQFVLLPLPVWEETEIKLRTTRSLPAGKLQRFRLFALNDRAGGAGQDARRRAIICPGPSLKSLAWFCTLWRSPPFFLSSFRSYVQRILFICQLFQHTKHCSTPSTIYQRANHQWNLRFYLELGLAVLLSQTHLYITFCWGKHPLFLSLSRSVSVSLALYHF